MRSPVPTSERIAPSTCACRTSSSSRCISACLAQHRDGIDACIRYLSNNAEHLRYDQALEAG